jgi:hypothetical protein
LLNLGRSVKNNRSSPKFSATFFPCINIGIK